VCVCVCVCVCARARAHVCVCSVHAVEPVHSGATCVQASLRVQVDMRMNSRHARGRGEKG